MYVSRTFVEWRFGRLFPDPMEMLSELDRGERVAGDSAGYWKPGAGDNQ